ncbi:alpha/beta fold hydrolase [[Mycobacterium] burgundiense]|uniref:Alpha/beta hydrolase n=1 Tax=[Mycobacterium] burgundiense TaxID=3064286 RepID=A0ABM9M7H0_9MYCO|nr:hypothetical protein [Mycolicibacterium sp. MU0053]CAJ1511152.1 hypothetical protein MU0053_005069 [Mycolicibacterium sp. MU0053]
MIGGEHDIAYETDNFRHTAEGFADSKLIIYPRTTHLGAVKHPRFAPDIVDFLSAA